MGFANLLGDRWYNNNVVSLAGIPAVENNAAFAIRVVSTYAPGTSNYLAADGGVFSNTSGSWRFDMVTIQGIPTSGATALLGLAGVLASRRRRA